MQDRINKIIKQLKYHQSVITNNMNNVKSENYVTKQLKILGVIINVNMQMDHLISHFKDISESIHLAKLNIIPKHILQTDELTFSIERLEEKGIVINNMEQVYDFLEISAFYNMSKLLFVIKIPSLENITYNYLKLDSIPVESQIIKIPAKTAMISDNKTHFIIKECRIIEGHRICNRNRDLEDFSNDTCFSKLIRGTTGTCVFEKFNNSTEINELTDNHIIVKSNSLVNLQTNCGITDRNLSGPFLIEYRNCTINLDSTIFENTEIVRREIPLVIPLDGLQIQEQITEKPIEDLYILNRNHLETLSNSHHTQYSSISLSVISILGIVSLIILYMFKSKSINIMFRRIEPSTQTFEESTKNISIEAGNRKPPKFPVMETSFLSTRDDFCEGSSYDQILFANNTSYDQINSTNPTSHTSTVIIVIINSRNHLRSVYHEGASHKHPRA